jgi:hypothetical protein
MGITSDEKMTLFQKPGGWFWAAILAGLLIRAYFALFTQGTYDVEMWQNDCIGVQANGLMNHYRSSEAMTRPPFIAYLITGLWAVSQKTAIPFKILLRLPFALLDAGTAFLLLHTLRNNRYRYLIAAGYWLHPLAMIFSAYHGNVDSAVAFFLILCLYLLSKNKVIFAGVAIGISLWVKPPTILAIPVFFFALPGWRKRFSFVGAIALVGVSTYIPALLRDAAIVCRNVFGYHGQGIQNPAGIPIWGLHIFTFPFLEGLSEQWQQRLVGPVVFLFEKSWLIAIFLIVLLSWLRRSRSTVEQLGATIAAVYTIIYGFSHNWSFQYFAWSIPFWFFAGKWFLIPATIFASGYIYSLYWVLCGDPWLLGKWDFIGHPYWPTVVIVFRNLAVLFFFASACVFLGMAIYEQVIGRHKPLKDDEQPAGNL